MKSQGYSAFKAFAYSLKHLTVKANIRNFAREVHIKDHSLLSICKRYHRQNVKNKYTEMHHSEHKISIL